MARSKTSKKPRHEGPEDDPQAEPEAEAEAEPGGPQEEAAAGKVSKSDAARAAIAEGIDSPAQAVAFIKSRFGIDLTRQHFSSVKSRTQKAEAEAAPSSSRKEPAPPKKPGPAINGEPTPADRRDANEPDVLVALENVKDLVARYGADKVKRMVDLLG